MSDHNVMGKAVLCVIWVTVIVSFTILVLNDYVAVGVVMLLIMAILSLLFVVALFD